MVGRVSGKSYQMKWGGAAFVRTLVGLLLSIGAQAQAEVTFFPGDSAGWTSAVTGAGHTIEPFDTGPDHIALSNEVQSPPPDGSGLGTHILTFDEANTCLSGSFTFATQDPEQFLKYRVLQTGDLFPFDRPDAIEMEVIDGGSVYALALEIADLDFGTATVEVFAGGTSLSSTSDLARAPDSFLGILSDEPFTRITYSGTEGGFESFADFQFAFVPSAGFIPGDFNLDDTVDGVDLQVWNTSFGVDAGADADCDHDSDGNDFLIWQQNFGMSQDGPMIVGVPEPAAMVLCLAAILSLVGVARLGM